MAQVTLNPSADTKILNTQATTNFDDQGIDAGEWKDGSSDVRRSLIKFDLSSIPAGSTITAATLRLYDTGTDLADNTRTMSCYRCLRNWVETEATWNVYSTGNSWGTAGADNTSTDRESSSSGDISMPATEVEGFVEITITAANVQEWLDGDQDNYGFVIRMATETDDLHRFDDSGDTNPPELVVTYNTPGGFFAIL